MNRPMQFLDQPLQYSEGITTIEITRHNLKTLLPKIGFRCIDEVVKHEDFAERPVYHIVIGPRAYSIHRDEAAALHKAKWLPHNIYQALVANGYRG